MEKLPTICGAEIPIGDLGASMTTQQKEIQRLRELVAMGEKVVEDFMPNIGKCALQDYGRLNTFLIEAKKVRPAPAQDK